MGKKCRRKRANYPQRFQQKLMANMKAELSWDKMKDLYIQVYSETFTQEDINGLLEFYGSPAGKAFVAKMPMVMQRTMTLMQEKMGPMMRNMEQSLREAVREVEALRKKD